MVIFALPPGKWGTKTLSLFAFWWGRKWVRDEAKKGYVEKVSLSLSLSLSLFISPGFPLWAQVLQNTPLTKVLLDRVNFINHTHKIVWGFSCVRITKWSTKEEVQGGQDGISALLLATSLRVSGMLGFPMGFSENPWVAPSESHSFLSGHHKVLAPCPSLVVWFPGDILVFLSVSISFHGFGELAVIAALGFGGIKMVSQNGQGKRGQGRYRRCMPVLTQHRTLHY